MDFQQYRFDAFVSGIRRTRWFVLGGVLISTLVLSNAYLEINGEQDRDLTAALAQRAKLRTGEALDCLETYIKHVPGEVPKQDCPDLINKMLEEGQLPNYDDKELLKKYGELKFIYWRTTNTLNATKMEERGVPFIGLSVPANDSLPIMAVMLCVFSLAVWVSVRSVKWSLQELTEGSNSDELRSLAREFFTFTSLPEHLKLAKTCRVFALLLPAIALLFAVGEDLYTILSQGAMLLVTTPSVLSRVIVLLVLTGLNVAPCVASVMIADQCDEIVRS